MLLWSWVFEIIQSRCQKRSQQSQDPLPADSINRVRSQSIWAHHTREWEYFGSVKITAKICRRLFSNFDLSQTSNKWSNLYSFCASNPSVDASYRRLRVQILVKYLLDHRLASVWWRHRSCVGFGHLDRSKNLTKFELRRVIHVECEVWTTNGWDISGYWFVEVCFSFMVWWSRPAATGGRMSRRSMRCCGVAMSDEQ